MKSIRTIRAFFVGSLLVCFTTASEALADRGRVVPKIRVNVEEPAQRAIIVHNGTREMLILQTAVKADKATKILEFMPLPAKPKVSLAPKGCFAALKRIVKAHNLRYAVRRTKAGEAGDGPSEAVKVVVTAQLGPHDVTVVEVKDAGHFMRWVKGFFRKKGLGEPALGDDLRRIVEDYLKRDLRFFAFDVVAVSPTKKTVQPLTYEFKTDHFYYPLKVTNLYGGTGVIELFILYGDAMPRPLKGISISSANPVRTRARLPRRFLTSTRATVTPKEVARLHPKIPAMLGNSPARLRACKYEGPLSFADDIWVPMGYGSPDTAGIGLFKALGRGDAETVEALVAVPFAFDRRKVFTDRKELTAMLAKLLKKTRGRPFRIDTKPNLTHGLSNAFDRNFVLRYLKKNYPSWYIYKLEINGEEVQLIIHSISGRRKVFGISNWALLRSLGAAGVRRPRTDSAAAARKAAAGAIKLILKETSLGGPTASCGSASRRRPDGPSSKLSRARIKSMSWPL